MTRAECLALDAADGLAPLRDQFDLPADVVYLDGNSLGALPKATAARVGQVVTDEWGEGLIRSWNTAGWIDLPHKVGNLIARLIGADPGEVVAADSTSVNLYKALSVALALVRRASGVRRVIVSERDNFPTDLYIAESLARQHACELRLVDADEVAAAMDAELAVLMLTHVNYRTGRMHDMAGLTARAHALGGLAVWDLAHSAGALPVHLKGTRAEEAADFAIGCGYKYLNGGPGAPGFIWVHPDRITDMTAAGLWQPLTGWLGHAAPFEFSSSYRPAPGIAGFACGTPPVVSFGALECGLQSVLAAEPFGGLTALREKSLALTDLFISLVDERCAGHGLTVRTPRDRSIRGSQVSLAREDGGYAIMQALIARGVIGDFRAPDILRFGFTPLYTRFVDAWDAVEQIRQVLESGEWRDPRFAARASVT